MVDNASDWALYHIDTPKEYAMVSIAINIFIIVSNILAILTFVKMGDLHVKHYYMLGLVGADLTIFVQNSIIVIFLVKGEVWMNETVCFVIGSIAISAVTATSLVRSAMSLDRWIAIQYPAKYMRIVDSVRRKRIVIAIIIFIYILTCPLLYITWKFDQISFYFDTYVPYCIADVGRSGIWGLPLAAVLSIAIPCVIQVFTSIRILIRMATMPSVNRKRVIKAAKTVLITLAVYYVCWLPMGIWTIWDFVSDTHPAGWYGYFAIQMLVLNSGMGFLIYFNTLKRFRMRFKAVLDVSTHNDLSLGEWVRNALTNIQAQERRFSEMQMTQMETGETIQCSEVSNHGSVPLMYSV